MDNDKLTEIIRYWASDQPLLIDALADDLEAEAREQCPTVYAGGYCWFHKRFNRAEWIAKAKGESC